MRKLPLFLAILTACVSTPKPRPDQSTGGTPTAGDLEADREVARQLRAISTRVKKGEGAQVRQELLQQVEQRPGDHRLKMYAAWTGAPSEEAWQEINRIAKMKDDPWSWALSGFIYMQWRGFFDQADAEFVRALGLRPGFVPARVGQADVLRLKGKLPEAKTAYEAVLRDAPDWEEAIVGLGLTLAAQGDTAGARQKLERALQIDPEDFVAIQALAKLVLEANDTDAAIALYTRLVAFNARDRESCIALGKLKETKGDLAGAAADYEAAMKVAPDAALAKALANVYRELGNAEGELRALEKVILLDNDVAPLLRMAELKQKEKDLEGAEVALRTATERSPDDGAIRLSLARVIRERDDIIGAIEAYRTAVAKGAKEGEGELKELEASASLTGKPIAGSVKKGYEQVFQLLYKQFQVRRTTNPNLGGKLRVRVTIDEQGKATQVDVLEDTVHDGALGALVYFALKDAVFPKKASSPAFEFVLNPAK